MMIENKHPYIKEYLDSQFSLHRLIFAKFLELDYDPFSIIDSYMQTSKIREKIDVGNWSALNKGHLQILNDIDYSQCLPKSQNINDIILFHWMADIYVYFQWEYNILSKILNNKIPAKILAEKYSPLHEVSEQVACKKLHNIYFRGNE